MADSSSSVPAAFFTKTIQPVNLITDINSFAQTNSKARAGRSAQRAAHGARRGESDRDESLRRGNLLMGSDPLHPLISPPLRRACVMQACLLEDSDAQQWLANTFPNLQTIAVRGRARSLSPRVPLTHPASARCPLTRSLSPPPPCVHRSTPHSVLASVLNGTCAGAVISSAVAAYTMGPGDPTGRFCGLMYVGAPLSSDYYAIPWNINTTQKEMVALDSLAVAAVSFGDYQARTRLVARFLSCAAFAPGGREVRR